METQNHYKTPGSHNFIIPTGEEFHRYACHKLNICDFCTDYPGEPGYLINRISSSIRWGLKYRKKEGVYNV